MNIEEAIKLLKQEPDFSLSYYKREFAIDLLLKAYENQQKEIELMKTKINKIVLMIKENYNSDFYDDYETIEALRDDIYVILMKK